MPRSSRGGGYSHNPYEVGNPYAAPPTPRQATGWSPANPYAAGREEFMLRPKNSPRNGPSQSRSRRGSHGDSHDEASNYSSAQHAQSSNYSSSQHDGEWSEHRSSKRSRRHSHPAESIQHQQPTSSAKSRRRLSADDAHRPGHSRHHDDRSPRGSPANHSQPRSSRTLSDSWAEHSHSHADRSQQSQQDDQSSYDRRDSIDSSSLQSKKRKQKSSRALAGCTSAADLPASNKNAAGWLWVSYVLANPDSLSQGCNALLAEQGLEVHGDSPEVPLMMGQQIVLRIHGILGVPFSEERALWSNITRALRYNEFLSGIDALLKTLRASFQQFRVPSSVIVRRKKGNIWDNYDKVKKLGSGAFGDVYLCRQKASGREYVIKYLRLTNTNPRKDLDLVHQFKAEFDVCRKLHHLNVVRVFEMYLDPYAIVMELAKGGALFDFLETSNQVGVHSEEWIAGVIEQVLGAVSYCHDRGVAHQDLKPDNILLSAPVEQQRKGVFRSRLVVPSVVVSDFGQAAMFGFSKDHGGGFKIGDPRYASPDAWKQQFSMANDVWAVGVTLYELLSGGVLPFLGQAVSLRRFADQNLWRKMKEAVSDPNVQPDWTCLDGCSPEALDLLYWILSKDGDKRPTAAQCLQHPWFALMRQRRGAQKLEQRERENFVIQMAHRARMPKHERALINVLLMNVENTRLQDARNLFEALDCEHTGFVSLDTLEAFLIERKLPARTARDLFSACGVVSTRNLEFDDFVLACWDPKTMEADELHSLLLACFLRLDEEHRGFLTRSSLRFVFPECILADLFRQINPKAGTGVTFDDFRDCVAGIMEREWEAQSDHRAVNEYMDDDKRPSVSKGLDIDPVESLQKKVEKIKKQDSAPGFWSHGFGRGLLLVVTFGCAGRRKKKPKPKVMEELRYQSCAQSEASCRSLTSHHSRAYAPSRQSSRNLALTNAPQYRAATQSESCRSRMTENTASAMLNTPQSLRRDSNSGWATQPRRASGRQFRGDAVGRSRDRGAFG